jgi:hypothetical protein
MAELFITLRLTIIRPFTINTLTCKRNAAVAQSVEQGTENPCVISSILIGGGKGCQILFCYCEKFYTMRTEKRMVGGKSLLVRRLFYCLSLKREMLFDADTGVPQPQGEEHAQISGMITYYYISI